MIIKENKKEHGKKKDANRRRNMQELDIKGK